MTYREIFIIALLMVASMGLSISPNQMEAIEFHPKTAFIENKKPGFMAAISAVSMPIFFQNMAMANPFWPTRPYVLPILPNAKN